MNSTYQKWMFTTCWFLLLPIFLMAQTNPAQVDVLMLKNDVSIIQINSNPTPQVITPFAQNGSWDVSYNSNQVYDLLYKPDIDFTGFDRVVVEYRGQGDFPGWWPPKYMVVNYEVVNSIIITEHDYGRTSNSTPINFEPTVNDSSTHGPLVITNLASTDGGVAEITSDSTVSFTPDSSFEGLAYISYTVVDQEGTSNTGRITVDVFQGEPSSGNDSLYFTTTNVTAFDIILDSEDFTLDDDFGPELGEVEFITEAVFTYTPNEGASGLDEFIFYDQNGDLRFIFVEVLTYGSQNDFVVDDVFYISKQSTDEFDVLANDLKRNFPIVSYTQPDQGELLYQGDGIFSYTSPEFFSGTVSFTYRVYNGFQFETGTVEIVISNFEPQIELPFELRVAKNNDLIINYNIPITNFGFSESVGPENGNLSFYDGLDTLDYDCGSVYGLNMVVYTPNADFTGQDEFVLDYCINDEQCEKVKVFVDVLDVESDECICVASCVWDGDTNNDGFVSITDVLPIGLHMGEIGSEREDDGIDEWYASEVDDWADDQANGANVKHVDANGDGIITPEDLDPIDEYYQNFHNIVSTEALTIKDYPFQLIPNTSQVDSGDVLVLDVILASEDFPVYDMHGLAFALKLNPDIVDSASIVWTPRYGSWFDYNSPLITMSQLPEDGKIEVALSRSFGLPVSGSGSIGTISLIVEDVLEGFRLIDDKFDFGIFLQDAQYMDSQGNSYALPDAHTYVSLNLDKEEETIIDETKLVVYPNPTKDVLNVHLNGGMDIQNAEIYSISGYRISNLGYINSNRLSLNVSEFENGIYLLRILTEEGPMVKKFEVFKN